MRILLLILSFVIHHPIFAEKANLKKVVNTQKQTEKEAAQSQKKINKWDNQTQTLIQKYRLTLKKIHNTKKYNKQLRQFIRNQKKEMASLRKQIEQVKDTRKDLLPLMSNMIESLENFINLDVPFELAERKKRVSILKETMERSDVSVSEKYRLLISVYELENEYGRTISAYKGKQNIKDREMTVNFLRIGRLTLIYQTLNKKKMGYWNNSEKKWKKLSGSYKDSVSKALSIAKKQLAPDLLKIPVPAAQKGLSL